MEKVEEINEENENIHDDDEANPRKSKIAK